MRAGDRAPRESRYEWNFCRNLQSRMRRKARVFPDLFDLQGLWKIWSIRAFDERYTAPHHGSTAPATITTAPAPCASWIASRGPPSS